MRATYIIGEIGQNHNGSMDLAKKLIDLAARPVVDESFEGYLAPINAVKFTKRDLNEELTVSGMEKPYDNPNSFGKTYGEHRTWLELSDEEHFELYKYAKERGLEFVETICAVGGLSLLKFFIPDKLKVASRDLTNLPLLEALAKTKIPIILSTGMSGQKELEDALNLISKYHKDISILHCLSQYPAEYENINLSTIYFLKDKYSEYSIGYSDHSVGIACPVAAVAIGADIIEKHITLDRKMKGADQEGSLGPDGVFRMVRDIRNVEKSLGEYEMKSHASSNAARDKLERSIATKRDMKPGEVITRKDIHLLSPGIGIKWFDREKVLGKSLAQGVKKNELLDLDQLK